MEEYFYADSGLVTSTQTERLLRAFNLLTCLFDRVGLSTNMWKMVIIYCQTFHKPGKILVEAYERQMMGTGPTFQERQGIRVECPECGFEVAAGSLMMHRQIQQWRGSGLPGRDPPPEGPNLPDLFTKTSGATPVPGIGVPGWSFKLDQPLCSLCAPPYAGHNCDPEGG